MPFAKKAPSASCCRSPRAAAVDPYRDWIDELRALFRGKTFDGVVTWDASPASFDDDNDRGNYYALTCVVEYQFDLIG
jgi:hypothetical protein